MLEQLPVTLIAQLARRQIDATANPAEQQPLPVAHRRRRPLHPTNAPVRPQKAILTLKVATSCGRIRPLPLYALRIFRMQRPRPTITQQRLIRDPDQPAQPLVHKHRRAARVTHKHAHWGVISQSVEQRLVLGKKLSHERHAPCRLPSASS
jgi:hypothetical protein